MRSAGTLATLASGVKLHHRIQGEPGAPWMVLLNGLLSDTTLWAGVLPFLAPRFRLLTFDGRGQGRSDAPEEGSYAPPQLAEEAWELLGILGVERPWLVGLSNGSSVALELLATRPGAFPGAILTSAAPCVDFTMRLRMLHWIHCLEVGGPLMQFDAAAPFLWGDRFLERRHGVLRAYHQLVSAGKVHRADAQKLADPIRGARKQMQGVLEWDIRPRLARIQAPVLLLTGAEDLLTPPWKCLATAQGIAGACFELIPGVGHAFPVEAPRAFAERVLGFVDDGTRKTEVSRVTGPSG